MAEHPPNGPPHVLRGDRLSSRFPLGNAPPTPLRPQPHLSMDGMRRSRGHEKGYVEIYQNQQKLRELGRRPFHLVPNAPKNADRLGLGGSHSRGDCAKAPSSEEKVFLFQKNEKKQGLKNRVRKLPPPPPEILAEISDEDGDADFLFQRGELDALVGHSSSDASFLISPEISSSVERYEINPLRNEEDAEDEDESEEEVEDSDPDEFAGGDGNDAKQKNVTPSEDEQLVELQVQHFDDVKEPEPIKTREPQIHRFFLEPSPESEIPEALIVPSRVELQELLLPSEVETSFWGVFEIQNNSNFYSAFTVKTNAAGKDKYFVTPNHGSVPPFGKRKLTVCTSEPGYTAFLAKNDRFTIISICLPMRLEKKFLDSYLSKTLLRFPSTGKRALVDLVLKEDIKFRSAADRPQFLNDTLVDFLIGEVIVQDLQALLGKMNRYLNQGAVMLVLIIVMLIMSQWLGLPITFTGGDFKKEDAQVGWLSNWF